MAASMIGCGVSKSDLKLDHGTAGFRHIVCFLPNLTDAGKLNKIHMIAEFHGDPFLISLFGTVAELNKHLLIFRKL